MLYDLISLCSIIILGWKGQISSVGSEKNKSLLKENQSVFKLFFLFYLFFEAKERQSKKTVGYIYGNFETTNFS